MNKNQFQFRRFWRLLRIKMFESFRSVLQFSLILSLIFLVVRIGRTLFSLDDIPYVFEKDIKNIFEVPTLMIIGSYFFSLGVLIGFIGNFLQTPVTNLERYLVMHTFPLINLFLVMMITFILVEGLWQLGLWLVFPSLYSQYIEVVAGRVMREISIINMVKIFYFLPVIYYFQFFFCSNILKKFSPKMTFFLFGIVIPLGYVVLIIGGNIFLKSLGIPKSGFFILGILLLISIYLLIASYRGFCRIEPNLQKTSNE